VSREDPVPAGLRALIATAAEPLREARHLLLEPSPRNVSRCGASLAAAIPKVEAVRDALAAMEYCGPGLAEAAGSLSHEVAACATLLRKAAQFHGELLQQMVDASTAAEPQPVPRVRLEG
jgi:hypothetical protein